MEYFKGCRTDCYIRQSLEAESLPGPTVPEVCEAAAALLALEEVALQACPLEQIPLEEEPEH